MNKTGKKVRSLLRGFLYWTLTSGPVGVAVGVLLKNRARDRMGPVAVPHGTTPDTIGAIVFGVYEYPERVLIERRLPADADCIELGCSIGIISRVILKKLQADKKLTAVEASPSLLELAKANVTAAGFSTRFSPIGGAVHYGADRVRFAENANHIRGSVAAGTSPEHEFVPCVTLANAAAGIPGPFSLVMDIEGSEFDVLANDSDSLSKCRVIIAEIHGDETRRTEFISTLKGLGFDLAETKHSVFAFVRQTELKV